MADWDSLIASAEKRNPQNKPSIANTNIIQNSDFEFGDTLEAKTKEKIDNALSNAELDPLKISPVIKKEKVETSGPGWYDIPKVQLTEEQKRDWKLLRMRAILQRGGGKVVDLPEDPPDFIQFGTIQVNPIEGQKGRISKKLRAPTIAESLIKDKEFREFLEESYDKIKKNSK